MNQYGRNLQLNLSGLGCWLTFFAIIFLLGSVGLGWIVKFSLGLIAFIVLAPVVGFVALRWWLQRNLVEGHCPVCDANLTGLKQYDLQCQSCGEALTIRNGQFERKTPPGTIDVEVLDVESVDVQPTDQIRTIQADVVVSPPEDDSNPR